MLVAHEREAQVRVVAVPELPLASQLSLTGIVVSPQRRRRLA